ncbi:MAG: zf-HC2 domain-containing protein [Elusimicrobia bacterium]|nr:zf-HC2 domain-containing protein [Elusimicrobiota bacterium]
MTGDCNGVLRNLSAYLDGELDHKDRAAVKDHLAACPSCAGELRLMAAVDAGIKQLPAVEPTPFFAARVAAAERAMNRYGTSLRRFLRIPAPAMAIMVSFILVNLFTFAFNINAMENGPRRELARKVAAQLARPASLINPAALARLCGECSEYMCLCMHESGRKSLCPCKDCKMEKNIEHSEENDAH